MTEPRRETLKRLIVDAERLMSRARLESTEIVQSAEQRARSLVDAATELYRSAETEAAQIREAADRYRSEAEADARALRDEAQADRRRAIAEARRMVESSPAGERSTSVSLEEDHGSHTVEEADRLLQEAIDKADRILRVARSEATARADEMLESARRRISQMEEDARRRNEAAAAEHREMQRRLRGEQLELKTRIAELRDELSAAERLHEGPSTGTPPPENPVDDAPLDPKVMPAPMRSVIEKPSSTPADPDPLPSVGTPSPPLTEADDDTDYDKAIRRFRRRA